MNPRSSGLLVVPTLKYAFCGDIDSSNFSGVISKKRPYQDQG